MGGISQKGFTLIEVMISVAVLTFGVVAVYEAMLTSLDTFSLYANTLNTQSWLDEEMWEFQDRLNQSAILLIGENSADVVRNGRHFQGHVTVDPLDWDANLYKIKAQIVWQEGSRSVEVSRDTYAVPARPPEK